LRAPFAPLRTWDDARLWLITWSAVATGCLVLFFIVAPYLPFTKYALNSDRVKQALGVLTPIFFGYLGLATSYLFQPAPTLPAPIINPTFSIIIKAPVVIFTVGLIVLILTYSLSNGLAREIGDGMGFDDFVFYLSVLLTLLSGTTGVLFSAIFGKKEGG
jgi:hypothetical protein